MRRRPALAPATLALLLASAACSGGGGGDVATLGVSGPDGDATTDTTLSEEEAEEAMADWADCMREHGIDVQISEDSGGIGIMVGGPPGSGDDDDGTAPDISDIDDAHEVCGEPPRVGREFTEEDRAEMQEDALEFAQCMRDEGIEDFPDPDFSSLGPGAGPTRRAGGRDGDERGGTGEAPTAVVRGPFGEIELDDPEVQAAFEACQDEMGGPMGGRAVPGRVAPGAGANSSEDG